MPEAPDLLIRLSRMTGEYLPADPPHSEKPHSLFHPLKISPEHTLALRSELGLPNIGRPNIILLFLESARAFELFDPTLSAEVYPKFTKILDHHGLQFTEAYTGASFTVQGQFTTLCSTFDRMEGPPVYWSVPYLKIECLQNLLAHNGYETYWMNPFHKNYSGKYTFESNHGTLHFFDSEVFKPRSDSESKYQTEWGVSDQVFLAQALEHLSKIHSMGKPFFAHLLTTGTHAPWHEYQTSQVSEKLSELTKGQPSHHAYLSSVKTLDSALGEFFETFFQSPLAKNTVVVVVSDHGNGIIPKYPKLGLLQKKLLWPRIMFNVITRNMQFPRKINYPVHQVDVAPLIASIAGVSGNVTWIGRDPTLGSGTPWVSATKEKIAYRTPHQVCASSASKGGVICWAANSEVDPLLDPTLQEKTEDPGLTQQFRSLVEANEALIDFGDFESNVL